MSDPTTTDPGTTPDSPHPSDPPTQPDGTPTENPSGGDTASGGTPEPPD